MTIRNNQSISKYTKLNNNTIKEIESIGMKFYLDEISKSDPIDTQEEIRLFNLYKNHGDKEAGEKIIRSNLRFAFHAAKEYSGYGMPMGDLVQEANRGMVKALNHFDPEKGAKFITFSLYWIRSEINSYVMRNYRIVNIATTNAQKQAFMRMRGLRSGNSFLSDQEAQEIADKIGIRVKDIREMEMKLDHSRDISYNEIEYENEDSFANKSARIPSSELSPEDSLIKSDEEERNNNKIILGLQEMDERSRDIIESRWLADKKETLRSLADKHKISSERVRQIEKKALKELKLHCNS